MAKEKFILTEDLIKVEAEPIQNLNYNENKSLKVQKKRQRVSLIIDEDLKIKLHMHCIQNKKTMMDVIENAIVDYLKNS